MENRISFDPATTEWLSVTPEMFDALLYGYMRKIAAKRPTPGRMAFIERCYLWYKTGNPKGDSIFENDGDNPGEPINHI